MIAIECYPEVFEEEIAGAFQEHLGVPLAQLFRSSDAFLPPPAIDLLVEPDLGGDDPLFGRMTRLVLGQFIDHSRGAELRARMDSAGPGIQVVIGPGAVLCCEPDLFIQADMPRWEAQLRQRRGEVSNLGADTRGR